LLNISAKNDYHDQIMSMEHYNDKKPLNGTQKAPTVAKNGQTPVYGKIIYPSPKKNGIIHIPQNEASISTVEKMIWGAALTFNPRLTRTMDTLKKFEDLDTNDLRGTGIVLDIHGTLLSYGSQEFSPAVVEKLREIRAKMKVCIFPDNGEDYEVFGQLGIPVVKNAAPKPDPRGFERAAYQYLDMKPEQCTMVGDNLLTDGAAKKAGMKMILVDPLPGSEPLGYKISRGYGQMVKKIHDKFFRKA